MTIVSDFLAKENIDKDLISTNTLCKDVHAKFTILDYSINEDVQGFIVLKIFGYEKDNSLLFEYEDEKGAVLGVKDFTKAEIFMHGSIKWDGCSNWHFDVQENCYIHFCGEEEAAMLGTIMNVAYSIARNRIRTI